MSRLGIKTRNFDLQGQCFKTWYTYLVYHEDSSTEKDTGNRKTIKQWEKYCSFKFSHNQLDWKCIKIF